ncbi:MAG: hypothetical protein JKY65_16765 [Planctomycetes bacterium]|nr:hypothetical protein [Planctomycetota bacterium]
MTTTKTKTKQIAIRFHEQTLERVEAHAERLKLAAPGVTITRTDAVRALLHEALSRAEQGA